MLCNILVSNIELGESLQVLISACKPRYVTKIIPYDTLKSIDMSLFDCDLAIMESYRKDPQGLYPYGAQMYIQFWKMGKKAILFDPIHKRSLPSHPTIIKVPQDIDAIRQKFNQTESGAVPLQSLIKCINTIFRSIGNYPSRHSHR